MVTDVPTGPDVGETLVMLGPPPPPAVEARKAAMSAIQPRSGERVKVAAAAPAAYWMLSSSAKPAWMPKSTRLVKPEPAVKVSPWPTLSSAVAPQSKSPPTVLVAEPLEMLV